MSVKIQSNTNEEKLSCPYCKGNLLDSEPVLTCEGCQTSLHEDCAREAKRCTTIGCEKPFSEDAGEVKEEFKIVTIQSILDAQAPTPKNSKSEEVFARVMSLLVLTSMWACYPISSPNNNLDLVLLLFVTPLFLSILIFIGTWLGLAPKKSIGRVISLSYIPNLITATLSSVFFTPRPELLVMIPVTLVLTLTSYVLVDKAIGNNFK